MKRLLLVPALLLSLTACDLGAVASAVGAPQPANAVQSHPYAEVERQVAREYELYNGERNVRADCDRSMHGDDDILLCGLLLEGTRPKVMLEVVLEDGKVVDLYEPKGEKIPTLTTEEARKKREGKKE